MHADTDASLTLAGLTIPHPRNRLRRYCGLSHAGGEPETWAFDYYDRVETDPTVISNVDVLAATVVHTGISRGDLTFFSTNRQELNRWLEQLPFDLALADASDDMLRHLETLPTLVDHSMRAWLVLASKVLHRKRPALVPLLDRDIIDWYLPVTGMRLETTSWGFILRALRSDLAYNAEALGVLGGELAAELGHRPTDLRMVDIAIWIGGNK